MKKRIRLTESDLHRIVKESVKKILSDEFVNEGWFGNDARYGEKWYNPSTWKNDAQKKQIRQQRLQDANAKWNADFQGQKQREKEETERERQSQEWARRQQAMARSSQRNSQSYGNGASYHAGEEYLGIGHSAYDDMGR